MLGVGGHEPAVTGLARDGVALEHELGARTCAGDLLDDASPQAGAIPTRPDRPAKGARRPIILNCA